MSRFSFKFMVLVAALVPVAARSAAATEPQPAPAAAVPEAKVDRDADLVDMPRDVRAEVKCKRDGDLSVPANRAKANAEVADHYLAWIRGGVSTGMGTYADTVGGSIGLTADASIGMFHPLFLGGNIRYLPKLGTSQSFNLDAVAGLTLRSYGNEWIKAGSSNNGSGMVYTWSGNCQVRRNDFILIGGLKYMYIGGAPEEGANGKRATTNVTAVQVGIQSQGGSNSKLPTTGWSLAALYDPVHGGKGLQGSFSAQGMIIAIPAHKNTWTGMSGGVLFAASYPTTPFWFTVDLGVAFEL